MVQVEAAKDTTSSAVKTVSDFMFGGKKEAGDAAEHVEEKLEKAEVCVTYFVRWAERREEESACDLRAFNGTYGAADPGA